MSDYAVDELVMLLSTDWFFEQWLVIGIEIERQTRRAIQIGCREIVRQIVGPAVDYWHVSFAKERLERTRSMFSDLLQSSGIEASLITKIVALEIGPDIHAASNGTRWALLHFTEMIANNSAEAQNTILDPKIKAELITIWRAWDALEVDCEDSSANPSSQWDKYVRGLTPDLPSKLCEYLRQDLLGKMRFEILWDFIHSRLTLAQRNQLFDCYRSLATSFGMNELNIPPRLQ
jgi:hypothetical protein